ncbi:GntR family transcriptional regulator [Stella humosa]|uniref:GntR family transcriptional regulator n=1 Tax=Stella humosa TaxID=94 RepID=A0A3N1MM26_9PROT|nr:PLP-dependent aminotransferase family protein [Stella humosa]ROQ02046.1 GntR family transcriptional regulator [Stella humosa]BBK32436.1 GntR family transcriptional regulator [Stella humosa]
MVKRAGGALLLSIEIDHASPRPVGTQLYSALRELMLSGAIAGGERLPATRTLANELGVSRTTVIHAFDRLIAEGLIESRVGAGSFVSGALNSDRPQQPPDAGRSGTSRREPRLSRAMAWAVDRFGPRPRLPHQPRPFVTALPAFDAFPMAQWARLMAKHWRADRTEVMGYGEPSGHAGLRRAIAGHLRSNRGIPCEADEIFIVGGAQQAFHLVGSVLLDPGDRVWFENPGAIGARNSLLACGADLVPVPVDREGLRVDDGLALARDFRLAFVTPSHQQPLGHIMSLERRFALLSAAEQAGAWIVEDDYDGEFFFGRRPLPTLKSVDRTGLVIYVGTFSKSLFPSLRLGFMLVPGDLVETFRRVAAAFVPGVPSSIQAAVAEFIDEGHFATHIRRMRRIYQERHGALCEAAARQLGGLLDVVPTDSGLHTTGHLPPHLSELAVAAAADAQRITVSPIARFSIEPTAVNGLVLGFGGVKPPAIRAGVEVLARVLEDLARPARRRATG